MGLTPNQQQAVRHAGTPLFIQAGAGTGKTFTLTKRLAHGLSEESGPLLPGVESVLTITFTNKAAAELLGRVRAELPRAWETPPWASTPPGSAPSTACASRCCPPMRSRRG